MKLRLKSKTYFKLRPEVTECENVGCIETKELTRDHVVPRSFRFLLSALGVNEQILESTENMKVLCKKCNRLKSSNLDLSNPFTIKTLTLIRDRLNALLEKHD